MIDYDEHLHITIEETKLPKNLLECLQCYIKGNTITVYFQTFTKQNLKFMHVYQLIKCKQNLLSNTVAVKSEVVTADIMYAKKHKQKKDEVIKTQCVIKVAECCLQSEQNKTN